MVHVVAIQQKGMTPQRICGTSPGSGGKRSSSTISNSPSRSTMGRGVLEHDQSHAQRIQPHWILRRDHHLMHDLEAFRLQPLQMGQAEGIGLKAGNSRRGLRQGPLQKGDFPGAGGQMHAEIACHPALFLGK